MSKFNKLYESTKAQFFKEEEAPRDYEVYKSMKSNKPAKLGEFVKNIDGLFDMYLTVKSAGNFYDFVENPDSVEFKFDEGKRLVYTYSENKGNLSMGSRELWATKELRSNSKAFNKGKENKMAMPNDLEGATQAVLAHYDNYNPTGHVPMAMH